MRQAWSFTRELHSALPLNFHFFLFKSENKEVELNDHFGALTSVCMSYYQFLSYLSLTAFLLKKMLRNHILINKLLYD